MKPPEQAQETEPAERVAAKAAFYTLQEVSGSRTTGSVPELRAKELQEFFDRFEPSVDFEYPDPRNLLRNRLEASGHGGLVDPGGVVLEGPPSGTAASEQNDQGKDTGADSKAHSSRLSHHALALCCGMVSLGSLLISSGIVGGSLLGLAAGAVLIGTASIAIAALIRRGRKRASKIARHGVARTDLGLRSGASRSEALMLGFRTGGIGLLVRPAGETTDPVRSPGSETESPRLPGLASQAR